MLGKLPVAVATLLLASPLAAQQGTSELARGMMDGRAAADTASGGSWDGRGFLAGLGAGLIGTGIGYALAGSSTVSVPPPQFGADYHVGFSQAYTDRVRERRKSSVLRGGVVGSLVGAAAVFAYLHYTADVEPDRGVVISFSVAH